MSQEQDKIFFRNYLIVLGLLALMIVIFLIAARIIGIDEETMAAQRAEQVSHSTQPVGQVRLEGETEVTPEENVVAATETEAGDPGQDVYNGLCFSCHGTGLPGIPQLGDQAVWTGRIAKGKELLYEHAINGFTGESGIMMPAKGGNPALSNEEVKAAVDYMIAKSQ